MSPCANSIRHSTAAPSLAHRRARFVPQALYVHVPYCRRICPYCDFAVIAANKAAIAPQQYVDLLLREISLRSPRTRLRTIYFGGGTPSHLTAPQLATIVEGIRGWFDCSRVVEFSFEANPEDVTPDLARTLRSLGITRVSLGAQSLDSDSLRQLGRRHRGQDVAAAISILKSFGVPHVNVDLIVGHPGQTRDRLTADVNSLAQLGPDHVSCYAMTYEPGTPFARGVANRRLHNLSEDDELSFLRSAAEHLVRHGFRRYEVSNFAKPGGRSIHNITYWRRRPYLGLGPGAASFDGQNRWSNPRTLEDWSRALGTEPAALDYERLTEDAALLEVVMLALRRPTGLSARSLTDRSVTFADVVDRARRADLIRSELLTVSDHSLRPTQRGLELADSITLELLAAR